VIHLLAIAGRIGVDLTLDDFDRLASELPCLVNLQPSGQYLMEDFCYAGGLPVVIKEIAQHLHKDILTVTGKTMGRTSPTPRTTARGHPPLAEPFKEKAGICRAARQPRARGAVIKPSAATPELLVHKGRAVVFESAEDLHKRIDDETSTSTSTASWC
jgi:L-arabonate dehydrase